MNRARKLIEQLLVEVEDGQAAGKIEFAKISLEQAYKYIDSIKKKKLDIEKDLPDFEKNFKAAQSKAKKGWTVRKDMPVIEMEDVRKLQARLEKGTLDINKPFADDTNPKHPFPTGLKGFDAKNFLKRGLSDGSITDDQISVKMVQVNVKDLIPIQRQIYFDKGFGKTVELGIKASTNFITSGSVFIINKENYIFDGHHRFLSAMLIDPNMKVFALQIDLPLKKLLPLTVAYSDAIGHKRNK